MAGTLAYDALMVPLGWLGLRRARRRLAAAASGRVLEVGAGTGLQLVDYPPGVRPTVAIDLDLDGLRRARARAPGVPLVCADAEELPFRDGAFDTALSSLVFCSVPHPDRGLAELFRVVKRGGALRMLEHVRAPGKWLGPTLAFLDPAWVRLSGGCHLARDTFASVQAAGFEVRERATRLRGAVEELAAVRP